MKALCNNLFDFDILESNIVLLSKVCSNPHYMTFTYICRIQMNRYENMKKKRVLYKTKTKIYINFELFKQLLKQINNLE